MHDDEKQIAHPTERVPFRLIQFTVIVAIGFGSIYLGVENGVLIGAWAFMGAIAVTWLVGKAIDAKRFGPTSVLPGWGPFWRVTGAILLVAAGLTVIGTLLALLDIYFGYLWG